MLLIFALQKECASGKYILKNLNKIIQDKTTQNKGGTKQPGTI